MVCINSSEISFIVSSSSRFCKFHFIQTLDAFVNCVFSVFEDLCINNIPLGYRYSILGVSIYELFILTGVEISSEFTEDCQLSTLRK